MQFKKRLLILTVCCALPGALLAEEADETAGGTTAAAGTATAPAAAPAALPAAPPGPGFGGMRAMHGMGGGRGAKPGLASVEAKDSEAMPGRHGMMHGQRQGGTDGKKGERGKGGHGGGMKEKYRQVANRLDLMEARLAKIEAMLEILLKR